MKPPALSRRVVLGGLAGTALSVGRPAAAQQAAAPRRIIFGFRPVAPLVMRTPDGALTGLEHDIIVTALGSRWQVDPYLGPNSRLTEALFRAVVDGMAPAVAMERTQFTLSEPYLTYRNVAMSLAGSGVTVDSIADLGRYPMVAFQRARLALGPDFAAAAQASPDYREEGQQYRQILALLNGRVPVIVGDRRILRHHVRIQQAEDTLRFDVVEHAIFPPIEYRAAFRDPAAAADFNAGLAAMRADGRYDKLLARYDGDTA